MKKTQSPPIICPAHIRRLNTNSGDRSTLEEDRHKSNNPALSYITSAAKKVGGVFSVIFFGRKKADPVSSRDQVLPDAWRYLAGQSPNFAGDSRRSSRSRRSNYDSYPEVDSAKLRNSSAFKEIYNATGNFSLDNKIGEGGFGTVYKGTLKDGRVVAVKRAKSETYDQRLSAEFKNEILALSKIEHLSLVRFYGCLEHGDERLIIIEYVSNGTLREHLDGTRPNELQIGERLDIAIDVAHGITYLHSYTDPPIIHRDIKASNILITEKLRAKVADFGFARLAAENPVATHISTQIKGTAGYLDPEYLRTYQLTEKSDVYSFGVLLIEMMTGRQPIESNKGLDERLTIKWALRRLRNGEVVVAMDPRLRRSIPSIHAVERVLKLARLCLAPSRLSRPSMRLCAEKLWDIRRELRENATARAISSPFHSARQNVFGSENSST
ncbi:calmodulin-binding receptor-like cytoplasmic kinase 1 [Salvia splendens]|uniref:calmodulin-binding receptor-like cytoplasmic kinase 1 n=1 Tax=Salvia splendens TaxID=180675 RepID=UPI0011011D47|nr:calmodulin-binding receptor-like cytoplasmic kinase 1 [Salvia splendens]XP_042014010.1 calmodulin-binding receptor-like cytoplasmic kinase 1 [Salvia splendens]